MSSLGPFVCRECIDEPGIQDFIENNGVDEECSSCKSKGIPVAPLDEVTEHMESCIKEEYDDTNEWAVYDSESGYRVEAWDTWELLTEELEIDFPNDHDRELLKEIIGRLPEYVWCQRDPFDVTDQEKARYDWAWFSEVIMHRRRFFFENYGEPHDDNLSPGDLLEKIFESTESFDRTVQFATALCQWLPARTEQFNSAAYTPGEG